MVRHARIELASQPWQGRVFNQHTHAAKKWRAAEGLHPKAFTPRSDFKSVLARLSS